MRPAAESIPRPKDGGPLALGVSDSQGGNTIQFYIVKHPGRGGAFLVPQEQGCFAALRRQQNATCMPMKSNKAELGV